MKVMTRNKRIIASVAVILIMALSAVSALATGDSSSVNVTEIMGSAVQTVQGDIMSVIAVVLPVMAAVVAVIIGIRFGMKYIKKVGT